MSNHDSYVEAMLQLGGYDLDEEALARVKIEFTRIAAIGAMLDEISLSEHVEPLPVYRP